MFLKILIVLLISSKSIFCLNLKFEQFLKRLDHFKNEITLYDLEIGKKEATKLMEILRIKDYSILDINNCKITDAATKIISKNIHNTKLTSFFLVDIKIREQSATRLVQHLKNVQLVELIISRVPIGDLGAKELLKTLKTSKIENLAVKKCKIGDNFAVELAKQMRSSEIKRLDLSFNEISDVGMKAIEQVLRYTQVYYLRFGHCLNTNFGAIDLIKSLKFTKVSQLYLYGANLNRNEYQQVEKALKDNKRLYLVKGIRYTPKMKQYIQRNKKVFEGAKKAIGIFINHRLEFNNKFRFELGCFELFQDDNSLWFSNFKSRNYITKSIQFGIMKNFFEIVGVSKKRLISDGKYKYGKISIVDLPPEILQKILRNLRIFDVIDELTLKQRIIKFFKSSLK